MIHQMLKSLSRGIVIKTTPMYSFSRKEQKLNSISQRRVEDNFGKWYFILLLTHCNCEFISNIQVDGEVRGGGYFPHFGYFWNFIVHKSSILQKYGRNSLSRPGGKFINKFSKILGISTLHESRNMWICPFSSIFYAKVGYFWPFLHIKPQCCRKYGCTPLLRPEDNFVNMFSKILGFLTLHKARNMEISLSYTIFAQNFSNFDFFEAQSPIITWNMALPSL